MKKLILSIFVFFGAHAAIAQSSTGTNKVTNATGTGHKLEHVSDTAYIPAKDADGSEKHDSLIRVKNTQRVTNNTSPRKRTEPKQKASPTIFPIDSSSSKQ